MPVIEFIFMGDHQFVDVYPFDTFEVCNIGALGVSTSVCHDKCPNCVHEHEVT